MDWLSFKNYLPCQLIACFPAFPNELILTPPRAPAFMPGLYTALRVRRGVGKSPGCTALTAWTRVVDRKPTCFVYSPRPNRSLNPIRPFGPLTYQWPLQLLLSQIREKKGCFRRHPFPAMSSLSAYISKAPIQKFRRYRRRYRPTPPRRPCLRMRA